MNRSAGADRQPQRDLRPWMPAVALFWVLFITHRTGNWGSDIWMYLSVGREVVAHGVPTKLVFSFGDAAQMPYFAYEWLSSIVFYAVEQVGGMLGLEFMRYALATSLFYALYLLYATLSGNRAAALSIAGIVLWSAYSRLWLRAELFGYICFVATLLCFVHFHSTGRVRNLVATLPIMLLWVNVHGSYLLGFGIPPLFWSSTLFSLLRRSSFRLRDVDRREVWLASRPYLGVWLGVFVVGMCNPYGYRLWLHSIELSLDPFIPTVIIEWMPTLNYLGDPGLTPYLVLALIAIVTAATNARKLSTSTWILLAAFGTLSISAVRHIYLFEFVAGMVLAEAAHGRFRERRESSRLHGAALAAVTVSVGMALLGEKTPLEVFFSPPYRGNAITESSANFIDASGMRGPVRNDYNLGNDLVYRFYPRIAVSMDSRIDAYGQQLFEQNHAAVTRGPETLRSAPKHMIVTAERIEELSEAGFPRQYPDWKMVYRDSIVAIYSQDSNVWRYAWSVKEQAQRAKDSMDSRRLRGDSSKYDESGRGEEAEGAGR